MAQYEDFAKEDAAPDVDALIEKVRAALRKRIEDTSFDRTARWLGVSTRWTYEFSSGRLRVPSIHRFVYAARCLGIEVKFAPKKGLPRNVAR